MADEKIIEKLLEEIENLKREIENLKDCNKEKSSEEVLDKDKIINMIDQTENIIKKTFSIVEGAIIGSLEGIKKNIKDNGEEK